MRGPGDRSRFPKPAAAVVEVGAGVGYIMQAFAARTEVSKVVGLDGSAGMIAYARQRIARDGLPAERFEFRHYDGVKFPFNSASVDIFYSVAAIQHVPKPFAYNIFREMNRCLKPTGCAVVHLLSWDELALGHEPFSDEIDRQIGGVHGHWHHYYDYVELDRLLRHGLRIRNYDIREAGGIWLAWGGDAVEIPGRPAAREAAESYASLRDQHDSFAARLRSDAIERFVAVDRAAAQHSSAFWRQKLRPQRYFRFRQLRS